MFVKIYGDVIDKDARAAIEGRSPPSNAERGREVGKCLETLLLTTVVAINSLLGSTWISSQRQGQGQPPFETKAEPVNEKILVVDDAKMNLKLLMRLRSCHSATGRAINVL